MGPSINKEIPFGVQRDYSPTNPPTPTPTTTTTSFMVHPNHLMDHPFTILLIIRPDTPPILYVVIIWRNPPSPHPRLRIFLKTLYWVTAFVYYKGTWLRFWTLAKSTVKSDGKVWKLNFIISLSRTLVCHDMQGGYIGDHWEDGCQVFVWKNLVTDLFFNWLNFGMHTHSCYYYRRCS